MIVSGDFYGVLSILLMSYPYLLLTIETGVARCVDLRSLSMIYASRCSPVKGELLLIFTEASAPMAENAAAAIAPSFCITEYIDDFELKLIIYTQLF